MEDQVNLSLSLIHEVRGNTNLAQVAEMGKLPSKAALVCNLRAFGAEEKRRFRGKNVKSDRCNRKAFTSRCK